MKSSRYKVNDPRITPLKVKPKRQIDKRKLFLILLGAAFLLGVVVEIFDLLFESKAERFERWLRETARRLPQYDWHKYEDFTVLPNHDFFLRYGGREWLIKAGDEEAYLERAADVRRYVEGSKIDIVAVEIDDSPEEAEIDAIAKLWVKWTPKSGGDLPVAYSNLAAEVKAIETADGWQATSVRVFSVGEMVNFMGKHMLDFLNRARKR